MKDRLEWRRVVERAVKRGQWWKKKEKAFSRKHYNSKDFVYCLFISIFIGHLL